MPKVKVNNLTMHYEQQGDGEPLILIPYLAADYACHAFQVAEYSKYFTCISLDPRGAGETDKPDGVYSTQLFADDVAGFMEARNIPRAHVAGLSLGAAVGMWLAAKCRMAAGADHGPDPHHLRAARPADIHAVRGPDEEPDSQLGAVDLRRVRARRDVRTGRRVQ